MERAVFVLKEAFDFNHADIASMLDIEIPASRQLLSRAKTHLRDQGKRRQINPAQHKALITEFMTAIGEGETGKLRKLLTDDSVAYTDGGSVVTAARIPLEGPDRIIQVLSHIARNNAENTRVEWRWLNGSLGLVLHSNESVTATITIATLGSRIHRIYVMRNPEKLSHIKTDSSVRALDFSAGSHLPRQA